MGCAEPADGITGPITTTFQYDAVGRRTRKTINGVTTDFVHDGINPVTESGPSGTGFLLAGLGVDDFLLRLARGARRCCSPMRSLTGGYDRCRGRRAERADLRAVRKY